MSSHVNSKFLQHCSLTKYAVGSFLKIVDPAVFIKMYMQCDIYALTENLIATARNY